MDVNEAYQAYTAATDEDRPQRELALIKALRNYANSAIWLTIQENRPDIVNEAVMAVMSQLSTFKGMCKFSTWVFEIIKRICFRELRLKIMRREKEKSFSDFEDHQIEALASYERNDDAKMALDRIRECLTRDENELIEMKLQGHTSFEIARKLKTTPATIDKRLQRLFARLRKIERKRQVTATSLKLRRKSVQRKTKAA